MEGRARRLTIRANLRFAFATLALASALVLAGAACTDDGGGVRPGEYYGNVRPADLLDWLGPCSPVNLEVDRETGDLRATAWVRS